MTVRVRSLDIVRGLAAFSVFATHLGIPAGEGSIMHRVCTAYQSFFQEFIWCNNGLHAGVIVFVVLSGFCIHLPYGRDMSRKFEWACYWRRRFYRIYPVLVAAMALGAASHWLDGGNMERIGVVMIENLALLSGLFPVTSPLGNAILMTVIAECWLYLVYPVGRRIVKKWGWWPMVTICLVAHMLNLGWFTFTKTDPVWIQRNVFAFLIYWWLGALAVQHAASGAGSVGLRRDVCIVGYVVYLAICHTIHFAGSHYIKSLFLAVLTAYCLATMYKCEIARKSKGANTRLSTSMLASLGEISYSLYVVHIPILSLSYYLFTRFGVSQGWGSYASSVLAVGVFSIAFYRFVEKPFHVFAVASATATARQT